MVLKCELCNIELGNDAQFEQHLEGKKHKRLESIKEEREKSSLRSLFVSGLKKDVFVKNLEEHFQKFGKIQKIIIDKERKAYAIIEYDNESSVEAALKEKEHSINNKSIKVKRRINKEFVSKISNNFEKKKEVLEKSKQELLAINAFLSKCADFDEQVSKFIEYIKITDEELNNRQQVCSELNNLLKNYLINSNVCIFGSTATGLATVGSDMDVTILIDGYLELNKHKQQKPPTLKSQTSSNNSANSIECDTNGASNSIEMEKEEYLTEEQFEEKYKNLLNLELDEQIKIITKLIQRYASDLQDIHKVTNSRCPVIRFNHEKYKTNCDITLNNYLAVENTNLVRLLLDVEPMLRNLIFIIRYWSKQKNLNGMFKFNSYTLIWLIIFYLQKLKHLPTIDYLSKLNNNVKLIHGWNCNFENDINKIRQEFQTVKNDNDEFSNFNNLLKGFFEFYSTFNFNENVVLSTRNGDIESSESSLISKKGAFNIQDPFDLSHNLASNVSESVLERFKDECSQANNVLKYCLTPHKASATPKCWGLSILFTRKTPGITAPKEHVSNCLENGIKIKLNLNNNNYDKNVIGSKETDFISYLLNSCLLFDVESEDVNGKIEEIKRKRIPALNQICNKVDLLGLNCSPKRLRVSDEPDKYVIIEPQVDSEHLDMENDSDEDDEFKYHESLKLLANYKVSIKKNTWQGRRNVKRELLKQKVNDDNLDFEKQISLKLIEENESKICSNNNNNDQIDFKMSVYLLNNFDDNDSYLKLKFDLNNDKDNNKANAQMNMVFTTFIHFLDTYLNNTYQKYFENFKKDN